MKITQVSENKRVAIETMVLLYHRILCSYYENEAYLLIHG